MAKIFLITSHYMGVLLIDEILRAGDEITGVVAWPDTAGWYVPLEYDVRTKAFQNYLPLYEPEPKKLNSAEFSKVIKKLKPDYIVSGYYPQLFSMELLSIPAGGCVNFHPTGLPKFRGLSPYFTHMLFGDKFNSITMHWLDSGADTGDIIAQASVKILEEDTGFTCGHRLTEAGAGIFRKYWPMVKAGTAPRTKQDQSMASVFNFDWSIAEIDWTKDAKDIKNLIKSISKPLSGAWTTIGKNKLYIWNADISDDKSIKNGTSVEPGSVFAIDGQGVYVKCGKGSLVITDLNFNNENIHPLDILLNLSRNYTIKLGN